jgi:plastocyanin
MTSVDKAAIGWSIAIVAAGVAIAFAGGPGISMDTGSPTMTAPAVEQKTTTDPFADIAEKTMAQQEEKEMSKEMEMPEETGVTVSAPKVEDVPKMTGPTTVEVSMPTGTSVPGCEETDACFIPAMVSISVGSTVVWNNDDTAAHTVTSGSPADGPDGVFDSSLVMGGKSFEFTFNNAGSFDYFCMVHPWMTGTVNVS